MRRLPLSTLLLVPLAFSAVAVVAGVALLLALAKPASAGAPDYRVASLGGLEYESMLGRPMDPASSVDAQILRGLPAAERRVKPGQMLFGAFIAVGNDSGRPLPTADRIELEDNFNRVYHPLKLPAGNPYAYVPRSVPAHTHLPGFGSPADDNLAATGYLVLFRIPAGVYGNGVLQLVIHDPSRPSSTASVVV